LATSMRFAVMNLAHFDAVPSSGIVPQAILSVHDPPMRMSRQALPEKQLRDLLA
jgi:hypothetical protein